jgi:hypothetical protein
VRSTRGHRAARRGALAQAPWPSAEGDRKAAGSAELSAAALSSGQSCRVRLVRLALSGGRYRRPFSLRRYRTSLRMRMKMIMLFTSIRPRECLGRAARHNGQFNPVAIEHPMVPEELCHSFAVCNSVRSADIARGVCF